MRALIRRLVRLLYPGLAGDPANGIVSHCPCCGGSGIHEVVGFPGDPLTVIDCGECDGTGLRFEDPA